MRALLPLAAIVLLLASTPVIGGECYYRVPGQNLPGFAGNLFDSCMVSSSIVHDDTTAAEGGWSLDYWTQFWSAMIDSGSTGWTGCAVNLLNYFGKGDRDPAMDRIYFENVPPRTGLVLWGYDRTDFCADCDCDPSNGTSGDCAPGTEDCIASPFWCETPCNPLYQKEVNYWGAGGAAGFKTFLNKYQGTRFTPLAAAQQQVLNHEMTHQVHENAVLHTYPQTWDDLGFLTSWSQNYTEFWAPLGEIIGPNRFTQSNPGVAQYYYYSLVNDRYGFDKIYDLRRVYWNWVMSNFAGGDFGNSPPDYTDDLAKAVYDQYIVRATGDTLSNQFWDGLGRALMENPQHGGWFAGTTGDEKVQSFIHTFGMARMAMDDSYRDLPLGWPDPDTKGPLEFGYYDDGLGAGRADVIPAKMMLGADQEATVDIGTWIDPVDGSQRSFDYILPFASDYVLIQADPEYFSTREGTTLELTVSNTATVNQSLAVAVGYLVFDTADSLVYHYSVEDAVPGEVYDIDGGGNFTASLSIPGFGGHAKTIVVVITNLPDTYNMPNTLANSSSGLYSTSYALRWKVDARLAGTRVSGPAAGIWTLEDSPFIATENIIVPPDSTLTIEKGAEVLLDRGVYLESYGVLNAHRATFRCNEPGRQFEALYVSGPTTLDSCDVIDSRFGVVPWNTTDPVRISNSDFVGCGSALYTSGDCLMDVVFESNMIRVPARYDATAVSVASRSRGVTIRDNSIKRIAGAQHPYRAIAVLNCAGATADTNLVIEGNDIQGFDYGIFVERLSPRIRGNTGKQCMTGIHVSRADAVAEVVGNTFEDCLETGLYAAVDSLYAVDNSFAGSDLYGIYLADGDCYIRDTDCDSSVVPLFVDSDHLNLDLGTMSSPGLNGLVPASAKGSCITVGGGCALDTLWACGNYIHCYVCGPPPPAPPVYCGDLDSWSGTGHTYVNLCQPKCRPASPEGASGIDGREPKPFGAWFAPNPTQNGGVLSIKAPRAGRAEVEVLDVSGRLVKRWNLLVAHGDNTLAWDGRSARGETVSRGVYFFRVSAPEHRTTVKVVVR